MGVRDERPQTRLPLRARPPAKQGEAAWGTSGQICADLVKEGKGQRTEVGGRRAGNEKGKAKEIGLFKRKEEVLTWALKTRMI